MFIIKIKISDKVAEQLELSIKTGVWKPGTRLPSENQLCQMFDVSRVSIRSALQKLSGQGLVKTVKGKGSFVNSPKEEQNPYDILSFSITDKSDRINLFEFRKIIEVESAYLAAFRASTEEIQALNEVSIKMGEANNNEDVARYDAEFHQLIAQSTSNSYIIKISNLLKDAYKQMFYQNVSVLGALGAQAHIKIVTAIEMRNGELAKKYMSDHLADTMEHTASQGIYV